MTLLDAALAMHTAGLAVIPAKADGTKSPAVNWTDVQQHRPDSEQLRKWFANGHSFDGLGVVCGAISGQFEMFELEGRAVAEGLLEDFRKALADHGMSDLWARIDSGCVEITPGGGFHWYYRVDGSARSNTKLARRPATLEELAAHKADEIAKAERDLDGDALVQRLARIDAMTPEKLPQVLIETRGEGGFTVTAPSGGRTHTTGAAWVAVRGTLTAVPTISVDDRDGLYAIAALFDQMPVVEASPTVAKTLGADAGKRPGDDYNARATWDDILIAHGWQRTRSFGGICYGWTRPGKSAREGISATTGRNDGDNLYVFSSSTEFEQEKAYSKFSAYALLEHAGDYANAARQLRKDGYGTEPSRPTMPGVESLIAPAVVGNLATVTSLPTARPLAAVAERTLSHSDDANGLALVERYGDVLRHCADRGRWYAWDGTVWAPCPRTAGPAREFAKRIARALPEANDKDIAFKKKTLSAVGISAMLTQAASDERVAVDFAELDAHPWELNTPGGIVNLRTGAIGPPDPAKLHTRLTSCAPDLDADTSGWLRFLDVTFGGDQELISYLQRLVGYSAVGMVGPHVLPYCHGSGGNGKGVFLETCVRVLHDYATTAPPGFLMAKTYQAHETEVARLAGARMVLCSEVNDDDRFDEARVKLLTGGDSLTARFMQQDHFTFEPTHQLWSMGNHQPHVRAGGPAFWRRLRLIGFKHDVPDDEIIDDLQGILTREHGPAVLSWIIAGAVDYHRNGLQEPDSVKVATNEYARDQDTVSRFLEEMCLLGGGQNVQTKVQLVRSEYESWCNESGDQPVSAKAFGMALKRHGIESTRTKTARMYVGLALIGEARDDDEERYR